MATIREIKRRITSIRNTEKITRAMKMVAAVKFRKAQQNVISARPYSRKIAEILGNLIPTAGQLENELLTEREAKKVCLVVITADRGLAGSFNTNLIKEAQNLITSKYADYYNSHSLTLICVGKKSYDHFFKRHYDIYAKYTGVFDKLEFNTAIKIVNEVINGYQVKKFDKVIIVYNEFKSVIQSKIIEEQFLPVQSLTPGEGSPENTNKFTANYIFEPAIKDIIYYLLPKHLNTQIWRILLESYASEQAARMTAMDTATNNANDLISTLQLYYNKARQTSITKELLEIVAGADALKETS